jgi:hypothetical protein
MENSYIMKMNQMIGQNNPSWAVDFENPQQGPSTLPFMQTNNLQIGNLQGDWTETPNQTVLHKEMMLEPRNESRLLVFSEDFLDFGFSDALM